MLEQESDIVRQRIEKMRALIEKGIEPFGRKFARTRTVRECLDAYRESDEVKIAGRITAVRSHGKSIFANVTDATGKIQIYLKKDITGPGKFDIFSHVDLGDILGVHGTLFKTHTSEITVLVKDFVYLSKSLRPLPEKWHGLKDVQIRYRQRYLDLIANEDSRRLFQMRSGVMRRIREFLDGEGFLEVETPMMQPIAGGAVAKPFVTYHEALNIQLYLRIAPELFLKRLLVGGLEKVYELNRNFRNEGLSRFHNPEFTMLEVYSAYDDYNDMMELTQRLLSSVCESVTGKLEVEREGMHLSFSPPWKRMSYRDALKIHAELDVDACADPAGEARSRGLSIEPQWSAVEIVNEIFEKTVQQKLIQPTFIVDYPVELCPLAKKKAADAACAERFELYIQGMEIANAYSELNDPLEQAERFREQARLTGKDQDEDFILALEHGMPCAGGLGVGIDRLVMILTGAESIREVILFPQLKPERS